VQCHALSFFVPSIEIHQYISPNFKFSTYYSSFLLYMQEVVMM